jgi:hypothetical protein
MKICFRWNLIYYRNTFSVLTCFKKLFCYSAASKESHFFFSNQKPKEKILYYVQDDMEKVSLREFCKHFHFLLKVFQNYFLVKLNTSGEKFIKSMRFFATLRITNRVAPGQVYDYQAFFIILRTKSEESLFKFYKNL